MARIREIEPGYDVTIDDVQELVDMLAEHSGDAYRLDELPGGQGVELRKKQGDLFWRVCAYSTPDLAYLGLKERIEHPESFEVDRAGDVDDED